MRTVSLAADLGRVQQCEDAIIGELGQLDRMRCEDCGERRFMRRQTVEIDENGEFVRVMDADTKDIWHIECYECGGENIRGG